MAVTIHPAQSTVPATILVIDDDDEERKQWSDALRTSARYTVLESSSAAAGLDLCRTRAVDCVVLDLDMPESGFHVLLELVPNRQRPEIAVVVLTHLPHPNLWEMAKHNGAQACLLKQSSSPGDLEHAIEQAITAVKRLRASAES